MNSFRMNSGVFCKNNDIFNLSRFTFKYKYFWKWYNCYLIKLASKCYMMHWTIFGIISKFLFRRFLWFISRSLVETTLSTVCWDRVWLGIFSLYCVHAPLFASCSSRKDLIEFMLPLRNGRPLLPTPVEASDVRTYRIVQDGSHTRFSVWSYHRILYYLTAYFFLRFHTIQITRARQKTQDSERKNCTAADWMFLLRYNLII